MPFLDLSPPNYKTFVGQMAVTAEEVDLPSGFACCWIFWIDIGSLSIVRSP